MIKNILILILLITNACTVYYIYENFNPETKTNVYQKTEVIEPQYFYRVKLVNGGVIEGKGFKDKGSKVDIFENNKVTITLDKYKIKEIEKVYTKSSTKKNLTIYKNETKKHN